MGASLDHAMWFHRPARADEWILFSVEPVSNAASRGLARGTMHTQDGVLVASIAQEALLRDTGRVPLP
jgi:acyl-CoA thioesterase-2